MSPFFNFIPLELPGRGKRGTQAFLTKFEDAAADITQQILELNQNHPFLIYGHSIGTVLGLMVTHQLEQVGLYPNRLIVSGSAGPNIGLESYYKRLVQLSDQDFMEEIRLMGGLPDELFKNKELLSFFLPILRADIALFTNSSPVFHKILTPVTAVMGDKEREVSKLENWKNLTLGKFKSIILPGNHFFIFDHPKTIANIIKPTVKINT